MEQKKERIVLLDVLRGFFIFLALWQHYSYYLNYWFVEYFREVSLVGTLHKIHQSQIGQHMITDWAGVLASNIFTPFVSQVYLTLAAFNLATRTQEEFVKIMPGKLKLFGIILCFFIVENFIVAYSVGDAMSLYPIMTWMIILSIMSLLYAHTGVMGIVLLFAFSFTQWIVPFDFGLETYLQTNVHPDIDLDACLNYFTASASMGFLLGYLYHHQKQLLSKYQDLILITLGLVAFAIGKYLSPEYSASNLDVLKDEHFKAQNFWGTWEILGIQCAIISTAIFLHKQGIKDKGLSLLTWIGVNSILVFAFHRIFFVHIFMPIIVFIFSKMNQPIEGTVVMVWSAVILNILFCYAIQKSQVFKIIVRGEK